MKNILSLLLCLILSGCAAKSTTHPGATAIDSYAYDVLLVEQAALNSAKDAYSAGTLPPAAKNPMNIAIQQYDAANTLWQSFHAAGGTGDATALQQALDLLNSAVTTLQQILGKPAVVLPPKPVSQLKGGFYGYAYS